MTAPSYAERQTIDRFGRLLRIAAALTFAVMVLGSLVRAKDAGLACPDWPLCYGQVVPAFDHQIFYEWFHRLVAGSLGILLLVAVVRVARNAELRRRFGAQIAIASGLMVVQIVLGGLTVLHLLDPKTVAGHLVNATCFFGLLTWMTLKAGYLSRGDDDVQGFPVTGRQRALVYVTAGAMFVQLAIGGMVSSNYAGLACPDFPSCNGSTWWPDGVGFHVALQMIHRAVAVAVTLLVLAQQTIATSVRLPRRSRRAVRLLPSLIGLQIVLGVINVFFALPDWASVAHLANAVAMLTLTVVVAYDATAYGRLGRPSRSFVDAAPRRLANQIG
jgi:cytochrome c oxidase assembly protein subunit 15